MRNIWRELIVDAAANIGYMGIIGELRGERVRIHSKFENFTNGIPQSFIFYIKNRTLCHLDNIKSICRLANGRGTLLNTVVAGISIVLSIMVQEAGVSKDSQECRLVSQEWQKRKGESQKTEMYYKENS